MKIKIMYILILSTFLFIGCGSGSSGDSTNEQIEQLNYTFIDKDKRNTTLNYGDIFQITYADDSGLFVYRKINDYAKSLDYFSLDGKTATYSHTLETFYKLETALDTVIPLGDGVVAVLKLGSMQVLTIHDYENQKKLSYLATSNFGKYIIHDDKEIIFENKKVDISDLNNLKFLTDEEAKSIDEQLSIYYARYKYHRVIKRVSNGVFVVRSLALKEELSPPINSYEYLAIIDKNIEYRFTLLSGHSSDNGVINIFELNANKVAIHKVVDTGEFLSVYDLTSGNESRINILDNFFHGRSSKEVSAGIIRLEDIKVNVDLRDPDHPVIIKDSEVPNIPDDLQPSHDGLYVYAGDNQNINLGNSTYLTVSKEYGFDDVEVLKFTWVLDDEVISTERSFTFTPEDIGSYRFILIAQDKDGNVAYDYVYVNVKESGNSSDTVEKQLQNYFGNDKFSVYKTLNNGLLVRHQNAGSSSSTLSYFSKFDGDIEFKHALIEGVHATFISLYKVFELDNNKIAVTANNDGGDALWIFDLVSGEKIDHQFATMFGTTILGEGKQISKNVIQLSNVNIDFTDPYNPIITSTANAYVYAGDNVATMGSGIRLSASGMKGFVGDISYTWTDENGNVLSRSISFIYRGGRIGENKVYLKAEDSYGNVARDYVIATFYD